VAHVSRFPRSRSAIGFDDLSPILQKEVNELRKRMATELQPLILESTLTMQKILEAHDHTARLKLVRHFIEAETKRLETKKAVKGMFKESSSETKDSPTTKDVSKEAEETKKMLDNPASSLFTDEPDAFQ
jgi:hypothetical protein